MTEKTVNPETDDARSSDTPESKKRRDDLAKNAREGLHEAVSESEPADPAKAKLATTPTTMRA